MAGHPVLDAARRMDGMRVDNKKELTARMTISRFRNTMKTESVNVSSKTMKANFRGW